jgi:hypothetical protein
MLLTWALATMRVISSDSSTALSEVAATAMPAVAEGDYDDLHTANGAEAELAGNTVDTSSDNDDDDDASGSIAAAGPVDRGSVTSKCAADSSNTVSRGLNFGVNGLSDNSSDSIIGSATL